VELRFGVTIIPSASGRSDPVAEARHAEELGLDVVSVWDHPLTDRPSLETWTLLTWIAARTSRIHVMSNVLGLPYRPPPVLAKMAETLDRMSGGRLILGLGAGSQRGDFGDLGLPDRSPGGKVTALEEAIQVIRGMWSEPSFSFSGRYYRVGDIRLEPKPDRPIPIWLGTYGPRGVELAGRLADGWIPSMAYAPPSIIGANIDRVRKAAEAAGRDPAEVTLAYNVGLRIGGEPSPDEETKVAGEPEAVVERLVEIIRLGFSCLNFWVSGDRVQQRERLAGEVLPAVRELVRYEPPGRLR
jgi:alkanesulfonate monooxygenase SsuD/methylene tetrahydromethanopterin reductase-like flavin-dependent oxidoreductase (luciferase family)